MWGGAYGDLYNADHSGWSTSFDLSPVMFNGSLQLISRYSSSADGNSDYVDYWFPANQLSISHDNLSNLDRFDYSNGHVQVAGWNANDFSAFAPNHYLILFDRTANRQVASVKSPVSTRNDVERAYPQFRTGTQSGLPTLVLSYLTLVTIMPLFHVTPLLQMAMVVTVSIRIIG